MLKVYPDTHIKVLTKEHFNNRCLHSEDNNLHKYQNGTLERKKQKHHYIAAKSSEIGRMEYGARPPHYASLPGVSGF